MPQESPDRPESKPEKDSIVQEVAEFLIKVVKPGGVGVGSAYGLYSLLFETNVGKAIASALIGFGFSYGAKLLEPVHRGNEKRLAEAGTAINIGIDSLAQGTIAKLMQGEDKYLQCQAWDCQAYRPEGVRQSDLGTPLLEEVFVPLELDGSATVPGFRGVEFAEEAASVRSGKLRIWELLKRTKAEPMLRQMVILAWGGYGKTTLLKHVAHTYGMKQQGRYQVPQKIPVLLVLRKYRDLLTQENAPNLADLITLHHIPALPNDEELKLPTNWAKDSLRKGDVVVMLDGFDEVEKAKRPALAKWLNEQMRRCRNSVFILTSRPKAYREQDAGDRLEMTTPIWVRDFNQQQRRDFVESWYRYQERFANSGRDTPDVRQAAQSAADELLAQIEARSELKNLAKNPLLLTMIVTFHRRFPGAELPRRRVELYQEICRLQLKDRPGARKLETLLLECGAQVILQMLALEMMQKKEERVERRELVGRLAGYLTVQSETVDAAEFLDQVVQVSELLIEQEDEYEFAHLSFQEYLAAAEVVRLGQESLLYEWLGEDWWKSVILLYGGLVNPGGLIGEMVRRGATDLAYVCLRETTKRIDPALVHSLTTLEGEFEVIKKKVHSSRYQKLEEFLKNQQWEEADNETYRLMIATVGKEEGQWFEPEELLNFPCEELLSIDRLWVKYGEGRFGFSVQKEVYLECGGIADGQYHEDVWRRFCNTNGWMKKGKYCDVKVDTFSPKGYLPIFGLKVGVEVFFGARDFSSLVSRLVECNIP
jgi:GUN4-like/NACHT domain